jgi:pyridoxal phosphate enzyme (YggS family)
VSIASRLAEVQGRIEAASVAAGRAPDAARLVAVSKTFPAESIREAYAAGQRDFGENYAQELREKAESLADLTELRWHFIGRVQRNKARWIAPLAYRVHAVDSVEHAQALAGRAAAPLRCLLAVNLGGEASKSGVGEAAALALAHAVHAVDGIELVGLMTMPPPEVDPRPQFAALAALAARGRAEGLPLRELSMGMSGDYEAAIAHGATWVRVGTAIFGARAAQA